MSEQRPPIIEIRDSALDAAAIVATVQQAVAQRRAQGRYIPALVKQGPESLQPDRRDSAGDHALVGFPGLPESLAELSAKSFLDEPEFTSKAPLVGPLIVAARRMWNWMSTKWYVRPVLREQSEVNAQTARILSDLAQWHELDARRLHRLENRIAELEARVAELEAEEQL